MRSIVSGCQPQEEKLAYEDVFASCWLARIMGKLYTISVFPGERGWITKQEKVTPLILK